MKKFKIPTLEVETLDVLDVIAASVETPCEDVPDCDNDLGL